MTTYAEQNRTDLVQEKDRAVPAHESRQYTIWQILGIWLAAGAPMWILGWLVYPVLSRGLPPVEAGMLRMNLFMAGLAWQFVLSLIILYREEGNIRLGTLRRRFWLNHPVSPATGRIDKRLWWLVVPFILLYAALELGASPGLNGLLTTLFPFLAEPRGYSLALLLAPEQRASLVGAWGLLALFAVQTTLNTFLGEEFIFRGVLLPKMAGVFGRWDWVANAVIFGLYHLHQPWGIPGNILTALVITFSGKRFRTNWFPIILHSGQSVYLFVLILGLVLGLA